MTFDYDLQIEALQADLDAAQERYARLLKEHEALKARVTVLEESQSSLIADLVSAHTDLVRYKKEEDRRSHLFDI